MPRVSFIMPAYNAAETVDDALDSIVAQNFPDWEVIVVDDGSRDATFKKVSRRCAADPRIKLYRQQNAGASKARNHAIGKASGELLAFLDADDWISPSFLSQLLELMEVCSGEVDRQLVIPYCSYVRVTSSGERSPPDWCPELQEKPFEFLARRCEPAIHCLLASRKLVMDVGSFDTDLVNCEDWDLWLRLARSGARFIGTPEPLAFYRMRDHSISTLDHDADRGAETVMTRATQPDPRVPHPDSRYADGLSGNLPDLSNVGSHVSKMVIQLIDGERPDFGWLRQVKSQAERSQLISVMDELAVVALTAYARHSGIAPADVHFENFLATLDPLNSEVTLAVGAGDAACIWPDSLAHAWLHYCRLDMPTEVGRWHARRLDLWDRFQDIQVAGNISAVYLRVIRPKGPPITIELPALGVVEASDIISEVLPLLRLGEAIRQTGSYRRLAFWKHLIASAPRLVSHLRRRHESGRKQTAKLALRSVLHDAVRRGTLHSRLSLPSIDSRARQTEKPGTLHSQLNGAVEFDIETDRKNYWEAIFADANPWRYDNDYEQEKYERTLSLVPEGITNALELACAEGHFTGSLAGKVGSLLAMDISETALARARMRLAGHDNISFGQLDFFASPISGLFDLIVCSEVLYFAETKDRLSALLEKIASAVKPGGYFLTAHAYVVDDSRNRTGFDWGDRIGAAAIAEAMAVMPDMRLERAIETELYRISLYRRMERGMPESSTGIVETLPVGAALDVELASNIVWGGASVTRLDVIETVSEAVPFLLFDDVQLEPVRHLHPSVGVEQLKAILSFLRRTGHRSLSIAEFREHRDSQLPIHGRPIVIIFNDQSRSFEELVLPVIERSGFRANVMLEASRLFSEDTQRSTRFWKSRGIDVGYRPTTLPFDVKERLREARQARSILTDTMGSGISAGLASAGLNAAILANAGFDLVVKPGDQQASTASLSVYTPAIECRGAEAFGTLMEALRGR